MNLVGLDFEESCLKMDCKSMQNSIKKISIWNKKAEKRIISHRTDIAVCESQHIFCCNFYIVLKDVSLFNLSQFLQIAVIVSWQYF